MSRTKSSRLPSDNALGHIELPHPLRAYQKEGVVFLTHNQSALLADEMGLGKTIQTILAIRLLRRANLAQRILVIAPRSLCKNWQKEFSIWAPDILVRIVEGNARNRQALYHLPIPVLVATYEQVRLDTDIFSGDTSFDVVVLDEAQRIKDQSSRTSIACRGIPRERSWVLTGTPLENRPGDLISLFSFVRRNLIYRGIDIHDLHARIKPFFLRRMKKDVLRSLPPIIMQDLHLELIGKQRNAYDSLWQSRVQWLKSRTRPLSEIPMLALITKLKQVCNRDSESGESVKLEALKLILENFSLKTDKALVFSQYVQTLLWLSGELDGIPNRVFHGELSAQEREDTLSWFRESAGPSVLFVSLKAGGVGLNLQEASTVVMFDRWWNPATEDQAIQRAHRFGRKRPLHVVRFLVDDTIEGRIDSLLKEKRHLFKEYIDGAENAEITALPRAALWQVLNIAPELFNLRASREKKRRELAKEKLRKDL